MTQLFRAMREGPDGLPEVGSNARALGIRPGVDVLALNDKEIIQPGTGGLSVSPDDPLNLPPFRRPPAFQGVGKDPVWSIEETRLKPDLCYRPDPMKADHGFIEPAQVMTLAEFQQALTATRPFWKKVLPSLDTGRLPHAT